MTVRLVARKLMPGPRDVLAAQGVPPGVSVSARLGHLVDDALTRLEESAKPRGVVEAVSQEEFTSVFAAPSMNAEDPVVAAIHPRAQGLALYAATLGHRVTEEIEELFAQNDHPMAVSLDAAASQMVQNAGEALGRTFARNVRGSGAGDAETRVLGYSPGYCGWHVSGQRALFDQLRPERIGITLGDSYLMTPLKSVSGVFIAGEADVHQFQPGFTFCDSCKDRTCISRMRSVQALHSDEPTEERGGA